MTRKRWPGVVSMITLYGVGRHRRGWVCMHCDRPFLASQAPRRVFLALLDHMVLDHHRFPRYGGVGALWQANSWTSVVSVTTPPYVFNVGSDANTTWRLP